MSIKPYWVNHAWWVVGCWIAVAVLVSVLGFAVGARTVVPGPGAIETLKRNPGEALALSKGVPEFETVIVVVSSAASTVGPGSPNEESVRNLVQEMRTLTDASAGSSSAVPLFESVITAGHTFLEETDELYLSKDSRHQIIRAKTRVPVFEAAQIAPRWREFLDRFGQRHPELILQTLSTGGAEEEFLNLIQSDLDHSLLYTLPITILVLLWVFGSVSAAFVPLLMAMVSLGASLGAAALFSHIAGPISATANQLVVLLVLAIGVDYSLFLISRVREEHERGANFIQAIEAARRSTGRAIFWSGATVAVSLGGLLLMEDSVLTSMAAVSMIAVSIVVAGAVYVLPSFLAVLPERWIVSRWSFGKDTSSVHSRASSLLDLSLTHPRTALLGSLVVLSTIAAASFSMKLGSVMELPLLPKSMPTASTFALLQREFPDFAVTEIFVIVSAPALDEREDEGELQPFVDAMSSQSGVSVPMDPERSLDGSVLRYRFPVAGTANDTINHELLTRVRDEIIPRHLTSQNISGWASGNVPYVVDETERYRERTPLVIGTVLLVSMLFLLIAFRSLVVPVKALLLNLLSTAASFGVLVICFQGSVFASWNYGVIEGFIPALLFSILFGLSMDYHVFLISRVREEVLGGVDTREAVRRSIHKTFRAITGAAMIMASVFVIVATLELPIMKQLGLGLAVAVILDATIIRSILLPASMVLLGKWNWYLPGNREVH